MKGQKLPELKSKVNEKRTSSTVPSPSRRFFGWWDGVEHLTQEPSKDDPTHENDGK